ncbi:MAG: HTTM domain-containing protein [Gemmatimonadales bacterium]|nr:HTTM domain-containing protein [Gemmatimonadales bacterium]MBA3553573.1 HTTM domain-containing protein [Gemmatimonadales bacterium]
MSRWFEEAPAARLALLRVVIGTYALWYLMPRYGLLTELAESDPSLFTPVGVASLLAQPLDPSLFHLLVIATLAANLAFLLGWCYRLTGPAFALLLLGVLSYRNSWSMIFHSDNVLVLHVLILGFTPAAAAISLDALTSDDRDRSGWEYGWPIRLMCVVTAATYFLAGVAKVAGPAGWSWAGGGELLKQVAVDGLRKDILGGAASPLLFSLQDYLVLFTALGVGSLLLELGAPASLIDRRLARVWAVSAFFMHGGIFFIMGITFRYQLSGVIFASFFPLERVVARLRARRREHRAVPLTAITEANRQ